MHPQVLPLMGLVKGSNVSEFHLSWVGGWGGEELK